VRCGTVLARRGLFGREATLAYTLTGLILIAPSLVLPFATVSKLGAVHVSRLFTGIVALWQDGRILLAVWAAICGLVASVLLLSLLAVLQLQARRAASSTGRETLTRIATLLEPWSIPEVNILAVLVAFIKLGSVVDVTIGPGLWCYAGLSLATLLAWRSFDFAPTEPSVAAPQAATVPR
jgi:paraquat-inducible protein A